MSEVLAAAALDPVLDRFVAGAELLRPGLAGFDQIGSSELAGSGASEGSGLAVTGTARLRSVTAGNGSRLVARDRSICSALTGARFKTPISNGSKIGVDNN